MSAPSLPRAELLAVLVGLGVAAYLLPKLGGIFSGHNSLTTTATNAAGDRVSAYEGAGVVGTVGAAANAASGGYLATLGQWLGGAVFDLTHPAPGDVAPTAPPPLAAGAYVWGSAPAGGASFSDLAAPGAYLIRD